MHVLRNVSNQSFILRQQGGGNAHVLPGRAIIVSPEEVGSPHVRSLVAGGFLRLEQTGGADESISPAGRQPKSASKKETGGTRARDHRE